MKLKRRLCLGVALLLLLDPLVDRVATAFSQGCWSNARSRGMASSFPTCSSSVTANQLSWTKNRRSSASSLSMVIEKMSDECIGAVMTSHKIGNQLGLTLLRNEVLFAGIVGKPERAKRTCSKYGVTYDSAKQSAINQLKLAGVGLIMGNSENDDDDKKVEALPFSKESKQVLTEAMMIAQHFDSSSIRSEHVLLALCGYNYGKRIQSAPAYNVLMNMEGLIGLDKQGGRYPVYTFCEDLVSDLESEPNEDVENPEGPSSRVEEVVIGGGGPVSNTLAEVGVDLTQMALDGKLDVVFGRDKEIKTALRTLGRRRKNNPCLIGDPGVGKTAIAEAVAQVLASGLAEIEEDKKFKMPKISNPFRRDRRDSPHLKAKGGSEDEEDEYTLPPCPKALLGSRLVSIELASLVAGTRNRGDFEEKIQNLIKEASNSNVILFIDEIHNLIGTGGGGDGAMNAANLLKPALARGELRVLGATTTPEYRRYIEKDGALERRFQPLEVKEPTVEETLDILSAIVPRYEEYHDVEYTSNSLIAAAKLSDRYISDRFLPDKAIDLLDEAGSMVKMNEEEDAKDCFVTEDSVTEVISEMTGIPIGRLDTGEKERLRNLEVNMGKRIKGQTDAVTAVAKSIRRARSGMRDGKRPVASFMFCGPTGVGKTELCKALAETYYGQEKDVIRIDMSEYMDRFSSTRLVGAPPGYVGYEEGGQLTDAVRRAPHSVVLFDEVEKAHEDVLNLLLQVMDEGTLTDGKGRTVSFKSTIFVMTSNVGSQRILELSRNAEVESDDKAKAPQTTDDAVKEELEKTMKPELLNRIDEIVIFSPLSYDDLRDIASNLLTESANRAADDQDIKVQVADNVVEMVTREGLAVAAQFGARPIRRAVQRYLEDTMAEAIMQEFVNEGDQVVVDLAPGQKDEKVVVRITRTASESGSKDSIMVPVESDAGIGSSRSRFEWQALHGPVSSLDDDDSLDRDTEGFQ